MTEVYKMMKDDGNGGEAQFYPQSHADAIIDLEKFIKAHGGRNLIIASRLVNGWIDDLGRPSGGGDNPFTTGVIATGSNQDMTITKAGKVVIISEYDTDKKFITKNRIENPDMYYQFKTGKETEYIRVTFGFSKKDYGTPYKIEKGNVATDWTPAPEDIGTSQPIMSGNYGLRVTADGFQKTTDGGATWTTADI